MDKHEFHERIFDATCDVCGRTTHNTTEKLEASGWQLRYKDVRCPSHNDFAMELAADINAVMDRHASRAAAAVRMRKGVSDIPAGLLEAATIWREVVTVNR